MDACEELRELYVELESIDRQIVVVARLMAGCMEVNKRSSGSLYYRDSVIFLVSERDRVDSRIDELQIERAA